MKNFRRILVDALFVAVIILISVVILAQPDLPLPNKVGSAVNNAEAATLSPDGVASLDSNGLMNKIIATDGRPTLLFVYASWCGYCKKQYPVLDDLARKYGQKFNYVPLSLDKNPQ